MASIFSKIVSGEIPAFKIAEDENFLAFLDVFPVAVGHTLVIPKKETNYLFDLPESEYLGLMQFVRKIAPALEKAVPCKRLGISVIGLEVPHVHVHLIPLNSMDDINFGKKLKIPEERLAEIAEKIKKEL